ncbi:MAG TPA: hypothetical protein PLK76_00245 [bacterium]|nr:hypothetical protein [bacterium]
MKKLLVLTVVFLLVAYVASGCYSPIHKSLANYNNSLSAMNEAVSEKIKSGEAESITGTVAEIITEQTPVGVVGQTKQVKIYKQEYGHRSAGDEKKSSRSLTPQRQRQAEEDINSAGAVRNPKSRR